MDRDSPNKFGLHFLVAPAERIWFETIDGVEHSMKTYSPERNDRFNDKIDKYQNVCNSCFICDLIKLDFI